jgi:plasmid maintenance system killer protein
MSNVKMSLIAGSFADKPTEAPFEDEFVRRLQGIARSAKRKLEAVNAASRLEDPTVPPSNRLTCKFLSEFTARFLIVAAKMRKLAAHHPIGMGSLGQPKLRG